jgi:diaminopimelate decarboxylase
MSGHGDTPAKKLSFVDPATFTPHFSWKKGSKADAGSVACDDVRLVDIADKIGTPAYVYSRGAIDDAMNELHRGLGSLPHTLCFAVKSNGNLAILKHLAKAGNGFDIVSGGELEMLRTIGVRGDRIVFSGVGKKREEIREALQYRVTANRKKRRDTSAVAMLCLLCRFA